MFIDFFSFPNNYSTWQNWFDFGICRATYVYNFENYMLCQFNKSHFCFHRLICCTLENTRSLQKHILPFYTLNCLCFYIWFPIPIYSRLIQIPPSAINSAMSYLFLTNHLSPRNMWTQDHHIIEVERDIGRSFSPTSDQSSLDSEFRPDGLVSTVHLSLDNFQTQGSHNLPENPVPVLNYPHRIDPFPYIPSNLPCFNLLQVCILFPLSMLSRNLALSYW